MNHYPVSGRSLEIKEETEEPLYSQLSQKVACFLQKLGRHFLNSSSRFTCKRHLNHGKQNYGRRRRRIMSLLQLKGAANRPGSHSLGSFVLLSMEHPTLIKLRISINATENRHESAPSTLIVICTVLFPYKS